MKKLKVVVYAICKNEEKNVYLWYESMREADEIVVLDTGSTDNTFKILSGLPKVRAYQEEIVPWRFDVARNRSLELTPKDADILVCTDLDEIFKKGWCDILRKVWRKGTTKVYYTYNWGFNESGKPCLYFYPGKIHTRNDYRWEHMVHEILVYKNKRKKEKKLLVKQIVLNHYQDKKKSRSSYLDLLLQAHLENPDDSRDSFLLAREYYFKGEWEKVICVVNDYLKLKDLHNTEKSMAMCYLGIAYYRIGKSQTGMKWLIMAHRNSIDFREPLYLMGKIYFDEKKYDMAVKYFLEALEIENVQHAFMMIEAWGYNIYDYLAWSYVGCKKYDEALKYAKLAYDMNDKLESLKNNYEIILKLCDKNSVS